MQSFSLGSIAKQNEVDAMSALAQVPNRLNQEIDTPQRDQAGCAHRNGRIRIPEEALAQLSAVIFSDSCTKATLRGDIEAVGHNEQILRSPSVA
jgi:hypothetical protein